jgi:hypothetical protein
VTKLPLGHAALEAPASLPVAVAAKLEALGGYAPKLELGSEEERSPSRMIPSPASPRLPRLLVSLVTKLPLGHAALEAPASLPMAVAAKLELGEGRSQAGAWERGEKTGAIALTH